MMRAILGATLGGAVGLISSWAVILITLPDVLYERALGWILLAALVGAILGLVAALWTAPRRPR